MSSGLDKYLLQSQEAFSSLDNFKVPIIEIAELLIKAFEQGNKLLIFGNGGSASDAQHIAAEFVGRFEGERKPLPAISLNTDTSIITALSNDYSFDVIFAKQIDAIGKKGDIAFGISTSGKSNSVLNGLKLAKSKNLNTILLTSKLFENNEPYIDYVIQADASRTGIIQQLHITIGQAICLLVDEYFKDEINN